MIVISLKKNTQILFLFFNKNYILIKITFLRLRSSTLCIHSWALTSRRFIEIAKILALQWLSARVNICGSCQFRTPTKRPGCIRVHETRYFTISIKDHILFSVSRCIVDTYAVAEDHQLRTPTIPRPRLWHPLDATWRVAECESSPSDTHSISSLCVGRINFTKEIA